LRVRLGVADLDLALRGQAAVIRGQKDVERGDDVVMTRRRLVKALALLLERNDVTPVAQLDLLVRRRRHGLTQHDEVGESCRTHVSRRTRRARGRVHLACY
jgi:hypothetical protein